MTATTVLGVNPRTGQPVEPGVPVTSAAELEADLTAAAAAFPIFAATTPAARGTLLRALADRLDERAAPLADLAAQESGLPLARLTGEVARTSGQLRLFAGVLADGAFLEVVIDPADGTQTPPRPDLRRWLEPIGPVLVYAASNFPFAFSVLGGDTASALAAGCPVVVKAHPSHPGLSRAVGDLAAEVIAELDLPAGTFAVVFGDEIGLTALRDHRVKASGFTGSTGGGRFLFDVACARPDPIPFYGELGSVNPAVVTAAAVAARGSAIAEGFVGSFTLGTGQFCTKPGLLLLPRGHGMERQLAELVTAAAAAPMLNQRILDQLGTGLAELSGHDAVTRLAEGAAAPAEGAWSAATLFTTTAVALIADPAALTTEHFGPTALVVEYADDAELRAALATVEGSLTATVHAEESDGPAVADLLPVLRSMAGRIIFNGWPTGVAVAWAMQHGGPWPATTSVGHTSVGATSIRRWLRPVCYQSVPDALLPPALRADNPWALPRRVDGVRTVPRF